MLDRSMIKRLAIQCGIYNGDKDARFEQIEVFAKAIAAHEREAIVKATIERCAKVCYDKADVQAAKCNLADERDMDYYKAEAWNSTVLATDIRLLSVSDILESVK